MSQQKASDLNSIPFSNSRPCSSIHNQDKNPFKDNFFLKDPVNKVDEFESISNSNTVTHLIREKQIMYRNVIYYRREWDALMDLLDELMDSILLIRSTLKECDDKIAEAEAAWLAFWGIIESSRENHWI